MTPAPRNWSLRRRLTVRMLGLMVGGWLLTILLATAVMNHEMNEMFDEELQALVATTVLYLDSAEGGGIPRTLGIETRNGERVLRILAPDAAAPDLAPHPAPWAALNRDGFHDVPGWRVLRRSAEGAVIEAAHATDWRREEIAEAALALLVLGLPLMVLLAWGLRRSVGETTAPVARLADAVSRRGPDDLSPVEAAGLPRELRPLATAFDAYLARIRALRQSERDFIANAAHELRTPLASLRSRLELSDHTDTAAAIDTIDALTRRVERLLHLSRLEAGVGLGRGPCDLLRVLHLLIDEARPRARHAIHLDDSDLDGLMVAADPDAVAILLRNLIENAQEHGTGPVRLRLRPGGTLTIRNPAAEAALPDARFQTGAQSKGTGLGLSIIDALAQAMDVAISRTSRDGEVCHRLRFPLAAAS